MNLNPSASRLGGAPSAAGEDAKSGGKADENATIPAEQRAPQGHNIPKANGPVILDTGAYQPGEYPVSHVVEGKDGSQRTIKMTRQDR